MVIVAAVIGMTTACNSQDKKSEADKVEAQATRKAITFADFKKIKGVDNVQEVPFHLFTKLDSVHFFVAPSNDSAYLKVQRHKLDNYYGFEESGDFYAIHFSIENNISNSIEAYVLKSEFTASFDLTLKGAKLDEIRSSTYKAVDDFDNKSFDKYGTIAEVSEQEFLKASKNRIDEVLLKNPDVKLKNNNWTLVDKDKEYNITPYENTSEEDGTFYSAYIGQSKFLNLEVFHESSDAANEDYYTFFEPISAVKFNMYAVGYPQVLPVRNCISWVTSNSSVGSDFVISKYVPQEKGQEGLLYVNFTNFKIADDKKAFWADKNTFYAAVYPLNSAPAKGKVQKMAFLKIQVKENWF
ncbi:hypothetical protein SAMN05660841_00316 [Sphingobacterium nematocida]|uniref:Uncharacterized protein n=2 Tax=Sphingobacterium nematocida TaxID=1513896 RepID=A0A1T5AZD7_9SPHI|nr:hypothetical protein SAMN05660841_00316 [Sphingobacterium nematocida]